MSDHISSQFNNDILEINVKLTKMGGICEDNLKKAIKAITKNDSELAEFIIKKDQELDTLESEIDDLVIRTIALRQPVADDLRLLFAAIKISAALERIGDLTKNIGKRTLLISEEQPIKLREPIADLGKMAHVQLSKAINAHTNQDQDLAMQVWSEDVFLDKMYAKITTELVDSLRKKKHVEVGSHLLFVAKNLERIGDHTTEISEMVHYVITGNHIDKERPKKSI
jgi:phosphate transport system protein|tara:strand:- start:138 stop:815 length:678 start_codon:yes stop_codon:yes gene_type:complete